MAGISPNVVVADDHPLLRAALRLGILSLYPKANVLEVDSVSALKEAVTSQNHLDLVLLDLLMPGVNGFSTLLHLRRHHPDLRVAIVSGVENPLCVRSALALGAVGYIPKTLPPLRMQEALRAVLGGGSWQPAELTAGGEAMDDNDREPTRRIESLTPQELRILLILGDGRMNKQIGSELNISEGTVKVHMKAVLRKLGMSRRTEAAVLAQRLLTAELSGLRELYHEVGASKR